MLSMSILPFTRKNDLSKFKCWWENNLKTFHNARSMKTVTLLCIIVVVWWLQLVRRKLFFLWKVMPFPARIEKVATCMNLVRAFYKKKDVCIRPHISSLYWICKSIETYSEEKKNFGPLMGGPLNGRTWEKNFTYLHLFVNTYQILFFKVTFMIICKVFIQK